jgi:hypothetical protein
VGLAHLWSAFWSPHSASDRRGSARRIGRVSRPRRSRRCRGVCGAVQRRRCCPMALDETGDGGPSLGLRRRGEMKAGTWSLSGTQAHEPPARPTNTPVRPRRLSTYFCGRGPARKCPVRRSQAQGVTVDDSRGRWSRCPEQEAVPLGLPVEGPLQIRPEVLDVFDPHRQA